MLLLTAGLSASCVDHVEPGEFLFDLPLNDLVLKSAPPPLQGKPGEAHYSAEQGVGDGRALFHSDYLTDVGFPRERCASFLDKLAQLVIQGLQDKGARVGGAGRGSQSRTVEYTRGRLSGSVEIFCLGDDAQRSHVAAVVDEVVLRCRG
jgi:hypothetical protein